MQMKASLSVEAFCVSISPVAEEPVSGGRGGSKSVSSSTLPSDSFTSRYTTPGERGPVGHLQPDLLLMEQES